MKPVSGGAAATAEFSAAAKRVLERAGEKFPAGAGRVALACRLAEPVRDLPAGNLRRFFPFLRALSAYW